MIAEQQRSASAHEGARGPGASSSHRPCGSAGIRFSRARRSARSPSLALSAAGPSQTDDDASARVPGFGMEGGDARRGR